MSELLKAPRAIRSELDEGLYRPGPWAAFLDRAAMLPGEERLQMADAVTRVSHQLPALKQHSRIPVETALAAEVLARGGALLLLAFGLRTESAASGIVSAAILAITFQPLLKTAVGQLMGVRYSYAYFWKLEPRFKMQYGTYLAAARWQRVTLHETSAGSAAFELQRNAP